MIFQQKPGHKSIISYFRLIRKLITTAKPKPVSTLAQKYKDKSTYSVYEFTVDVANEIFLVEYPDTYKKCSTMEQVRDFLKTLKINIENKCIKMLDKMDTSYCQ